MKKLFFTFILVFCLAAVFAETGYKGTAWSTKRNSLDFGNLAETWQPDDETQVITFGTTFVGDGALCSYYFYNNELTGVTLCYQENTTKNLLEKLKKENKVFEIQTECLLYSETFDFKKELKKENKVQPSFDESETSEKYLTFLVEQLKLYTKAKDIEKKGYKNIKKAKKKEWGIGKIYIYDYNEDTRLYIFTPYTFDHVAFVAYVPHFKDY